VHRRPTPILSLLFAVPPPPGLFGAILGLGGGILIVPFLTIMMGEPLPLAIGTSLVAVIATSTGAAAHNVATGRADVRLGLTLEVGTIVGATAGGVIAGLVAEQLVAGLFAGLLAYTSLSLLRSAVRPSADDDATDNLDPGARDGVEAPTYRSRRLPLALAGSAGAGIVSALLGVGGGIVKVPLLRMVMGVPMHVAAATSNFVIGVTAAAGAYAYLLRGDVEPASAGPVVLGAMAGATIGVRLAPLLRARWLTLLFVVVTAWVSIEMAMRAIGGAR
jgi:uncharacterized protein